MINGELVIEWKKEKSIQCEDFDEDTGEKEYTMPVSYTHLDVYKRQG